MAQFLNMYSVDLQKPTGPQPLRQMVCAGDNKANRIGAIVTSDGGTVSLGGSCVGKVVRADGTTVQLSGTISGNQAYVVLDQASCAISGQIQVAVCWVSGSNVTTLVIAYGSVVSTQTGSPVQPSTPIPDLTQLLAEIENMRTATAAATAAATGALANFAGAFNETAVYTAGQYVTYTDGKFYRLTADHAANVTWANTSKVAVTTGGELIGLKQAIATENANMMANFAGAFVQATAYPAGTYVTYTDGNLYILPNGHEANATWANTTKTQVSVGRELRDLKSASSVFANDVYDADCLVNLHVDKLAEHYVITSDGVIAVNAERDMFVIDTTFIKTFTTSGSSMAMVGYYSDYPTLGSVAIDNTRHLNVAHGTMTVPDGCNYMAIATNTSATSSITAKTGNKNNKQKIAELDGKVDTLTASVNTKESNLITRIKNTISDAKNMLFYGERYQNKYYNTSLQDNSGYDVFKVSVTSGTTYYIPCGIRFLSKTGENIMGETSGVVTYTADFTGDLYVTLGHLSTPNWIMTTEVNWKYVRPYDAPSNFYYGLKQTTGQNETFAMSQKATTDAIQGASERNFLSTKKWVACGDSFTQGDFDNAPVDDYHIVGGKYNGKLKVYPYIIGNRTNMTIVNEAIGGSTMAYINGSRHEFSTPNGRYTQIPSDADYITLKFGINDANQSVPIGTINDDVNTTFYGAWNIVLEYLITNHPTAKIGIIVTNGSEMAYVNATIAVAEKWGIPYLNEATGTNVPTVLRTNKNVPEIVKTTLMNTYAVNVAMNNKHPNAKAHEFESYFVETWLKTL